MTYIYLVENCYNDPNKVYIGKTKDPNNRKANHKKTYGDSIEYNVIDKIDSLDKVNWKPLESYWIEQFKQWGFNVLNKNSGGGGPLVVSTETKNKISNSLAGRPKSEEHKAKLRKTRSKEFGKRISQALTGKSKSEKHRIKMSESRIGKVRSEETKRKMSEVATGRKQSKEHIANRIASLKRNKNKI
jgi:hypothetical protein